MRIDVFTIFADVVDAFADAALLGKARTRGLVDLRCHDLRDHAPGVHRAVDDSPFGGGAGMVMTPEPIFAAVEAVDPPRPLFLLGPGGRRFDQALARQLAAGDGFSLVCGRYEGVDARVGEHLCDDELSVGDYVLAGGEVAALVVAEAVARLVPGVMGNEASAGDESFGPEGSPEGSPESNDDGPGLLEYPHYTRPAEFRGWTVPDVLRSGDHQRVAAWRAAAALARTVERRPDLIEARGGLTDDERTALAAAGMAPYAATFPPGAAAVDVAVVAPPEHPHPDLPRS